MNKTPILLFAAVILWTTGCATHQAKMPSLKPAEPMVQVIPPQGAREPRVAEVPSRPEPIYINPVIDEVELASYINDDGNLVFPGKVLVIREPGHWNLVGAQKNSKYYVPADNQPPQLAPPSKGYYDYIQSKRNGHVTAHLDVSRVRVLGYAQKEEQKEAESKLLPGETTAYDPYLGWLAIPDSPEVEELAPSSPQTPAPAASPEKHREAAAKAAPALEQPPEKPGETNAPTTSVRPESADFAKEQQKKLRGMVEDAFRKAEQAHDQGINQTNHTNQTNQP